MEKSTDREVREKLASRGVDALTDTELLSILLREGFAGRTALELADSLLADHGYSLSHLAGSDIQRLRKSAGIGMNRAAVLAASFELNRRIRDCETTTPTIIRSDEDVVTMFRPMMSRLKHEEMWALYLTSANGVIEKSRVSQGGITAMITDYKLIVKRAVELLASSLIIIHNHPSGIAEPSTEDIALTNRLAEAAALFDIRLMDHIIITETATYSFRQHSLVK